MPATLLAMFRMEAAELLERLRSGLLAVDRSDQPVSLEPLLRAAHTLKGAARVVKEAGIAHSAHALEEDAAPYRAGDALVPQPLRQRLWAHIDTIAGQLRALGAANLDGGLAPAPTDTETGRIMAVAMTDIDRLVTSLVGTLGQAARLRQTAASAADSGPGDRWVSGLLDQADRLIAALTTARDQANRLRLVPLQGLFPVLERTALDAGRELSRQVRFEAVGGDVRLEADLVLALQGALVQLVRNAVVHGIEPPEERQRLGKEAFGLVRVTMQRQGRQIVITCADDGRGLDEAALRQAAVQAGALSAEQAAELRPDEVWQLALQPGVSTAGAVSELSGRGSGLDVVHGAVARLGGTLALRSTPGRGTAVMVTVPMSLQAGDMLQVLVGGRPYALRSEDPIRVRWLGPDDLTLVAGQMAVAADGDTVPYAPLGPLLALPAAAACRSVVFLRAGDRKAAVGVDRLLGMTEMVYWPLPPVTGPVPGVIGAGFDALGDPVPVLAADQLVEMVDRQTQGPGVVAGPSPSPVHRLLVVDDSVTTRTLEQGLLESAGYQVDAVGTAEEALDRLPSGDYSLLLVDVELPGLSGLDLVARVRAEPVWQHLPIILVTSLASAEDRRRGAAAGADAYVVKSEFDQERLLELVRQYTG
jgi:two-component system chemotaxis sensor kinase CheA